MKRIVFILIALLAVMVPAVAFANGYGDPGCPYLTTELEDIAGVVLVGVAAGVMLFLRRP